MYDLRQHHAVWAQHVSSFNPALLRLQQSMNDAIRQARKVPGPKIQCIIYIYICVYSLISIYMQFINIYLYII